jgi:hypothetical protein
MKGHKAYKRGGKSEMGVSVSDKTPKKVYAGADSNVLKEAKERKKGGKVCAKVDGEMSRPRLDRPGRKRGGRIGSDTAPLSSAARVKDAPGRHLASE